MQIVIELPEKVKQALDNNEEYRLYTESICHVMLTAIKNGTLLPDKLDKIRADIERLHYHPKLDFIKNDVVVDMTLDIIDKYKRESEGSTNGEENNI